MRIRPKEVNRKVNLLVDPNPSFMALVDNGANQTPFNAVKRNKVTKVPPKEKHVMAANKAGKGSQRRGFLQKMQFSKAKFATKAAVKKYLTDNEIVGAAPITDGDDVWVVKSTEDATQFKLGKAAATPCNDDGVTAFISPIISAKAAPVEDDEEEEEDDAEDGEDGEDGDEEEVEASDDDDDTDEDDEEEEEAEEKPKPRKKAAASKVKIVDGKKTTAKTVKRKPTKKADDDDDQADPLLELPPALAQKFDWWGAYVSGDQTLSGVLKDGSYDGMPPGLETVMMAASYTIGNILTSDDDDADKQTSLKQVGEEMADFAFGLYGIFAKANTDTTKSVNKTVRKKAAAFVDSFSASVASATKDGTFDNVIEDEDEEEEVAPKPKAKKSTSKSRIKNDPVEDEDGDDEENPGMTAFTSALRKAIAPVVKRIDAMESRGTSRKSMSDSIEDLVDDEEDDEAEQEEIQRTAADLRSAMGQPRSRSN